MTLDRDYLLNDRYRILEILGQGGMGAVYRAIDENLGVEVAVKENLFTTDEYTRQFTREATILASLRHSNMPRVSDHFEILGQGQYLVMDYIEGEDLRQRMDRVGILPDEEVIIMGAGICDALEYLHTRTPPILHRDIKPGNIKIAPNGSVYLVDFGLAKIVKGTQATTTGARAMTPGYSSPEQYGTARTDPRSDVYSLGATMYAALTGAIPEDGLARAMEQADLTTVRKRNPRVGRRLAQVLEKALEIHPEDRYQSAEDFKFGLLGASTATRRRIEEGDATIPPPPFIDIDEDVDLESETVGREIVGDISAPSPIIQPVIRGESTIRLRRKRRRKITRIAGVIVLVLVVLGGVYFGANGGFGGLLPFQIGGDPTATEFAGVDRATETLTPEPEPTEPVPVETDTPVPPTEVVLATETTLDPTTEPQSTETLVTVEPTATLTTPQGERAIAFASDRSGSIQIWIYNLHSGEMVQVTDKLRGACQPDFSPDGTWLVYISPCTTRSDNYTDSRMYIVNLDDPEVEHRLETWPGSFDPTWSPVNENEILFVRYIDAINSGIFKYNLNTDEVVQMTGTYTTLNLTPAWAPDGESFAFVSTRLGGTRIYIMENRPGAEPQVLTRSGALTISFPAWSPDGREIIFVGKPIDVEGSVFNLYVVGLNMLEVVDVADYFDEHFSLAPVPEVDPEYSPDGEWILMESWPEGDNHNIYIVTHEGGDKQPIDTHPGLDFDPVWQPIVP